MTFHEHSRVPGASVSLEDHKRIQAEAERLGVSRFDLAWEGLHRLFTSPRSRTQETTQ